MLQEVTYIEESGSIHDSSGDLPATLTTGVMADRRGEHPLIPTPWAP